MIMALTRFRRRCRWLRLVTVLALVLVAAGVWIALAHAKPSPNDADPFWKGGYIGTSWTFDVTGIVKSEDGTYLRGHLISPRAGRQPKLNFIIPGEWSCGR